MPPETTELVSTWQAPRGRYVAAAPIAVAVSLPATELDVVAVLEVTADLATVAEVAPVPVPPAVSLPGVEETTTSPHAAVPADGAPTELAADSVLPSDQDLANTTPPDTAADTPTIDVRSVETHLALVAGMLRIFGMDEPTPELVDQLVTLAEQSLAAQDTRASVEQRLDALQTRLEATEDREHEFVEQADEAEQNYAQSQYEKNALADKVLYLQRALARLDQSETAWSDVPEHERTQRPDSFEQLLDTVGTLNNVVFTGSRDVTIELDSHDMLGTLAGKAWDLLLVLQDYANTKKDGRCTASLHEYLRNTPPGCRSYSANQYAPVESDTVRNKPDWHGDRVFPVPESIDPHKRVFMESHFRLSAKKSVSPRVYIHDATRKDGKVYVGYIGRHLENTKS